MSNPDYLHVNPNDFRTSVVIRPTDEPADARVVKLVVLKRFVNGGDVKTVGVGVLRAIVHDWLLLSGALRKPDHNGVEGNATVQGD